MMKSSRDTKRPRSCVLIPALGHSEFRHLDKMGQIAIQCGQERPGKGVQRASCASARCAAATGSGTSPIGELISHVGHAPCLARLNMHNLNAPTIYISVRALPVTSRIAAGKYECACTLARGAPVQGSSQCISEILKYVCCSDGCCGGSMETIDLRRVTEIHFHRSLPQLCVNRGTVGPETLPAV